MSESVNISEDGRSEKRRRGSLAGVAQLLWSFADVLGSKVLVLVTFIALASYLDPKDFGIVAVATAIIGSLIAAMDSSVGGALIQRQDADDTYLDTGFTLSAIASVGFATLLALAGIIAKYLYGAETFFNVFCALSPVIVLHCLTIAHQSYLVRQNRMGVLARARLLSVLVGSAVALGWAMLDASYWVLIVQQVSGILTFSATIWLTSNWFPRFRIVRSAASDIFKFSKYFWGWGGVIALERNVDLWLIGAVLGPTALGLYTTTQRFGAIVYEVTTSPVIRLILPAYSRIQNDHEALRERILAVSVATTAAALPMFVGLGILSSDIIALLLEPKWQPVGELLPFFLVVMFFYASAMYDYQFLTATNRPDTVLKQTTVGLVLQVLAIACGVPFGLLGVMAGLLIRGIIIKCLVFREVQKSIGIGVAPYLRSLTPAVVSSLAMLLSLMTMRHFHLLSDDLLTRAVTNAACGAIVYVACILLLFRQTLGDTTRLLIPGAPDAAMMELAPSHQPG